MCPQNYAIQPIKKHKAFIDHILKYPTLVYPYYLLFLEQTSPMRNSETYGLVIAAQKWMTNGIWIEWLLLCLIFGEPHTVRLVGQRLHRPLVTGKLHPGQCLKE